MHFTTSLLSALCAIPAVLGASTSGTTYATYSVDYDNGDTSLNNVACSNGDNGLITKGYTTLNTLPAYPYVAGFSEVTGWNSPACGSCWAVGYNDTVIYVIAIDTSGVGFGLSTKAMQDLTASEGIELGKVEVTYSPADDSYCYESDRIED
ncbi:hypothetical protein NLI96_g5318 [Meripilus lineatus]|uniref:Cerato-platanin n=1 Tax=Meripilus lineatus TaxID=2056292 RepID=A0AAD5V3Q8_9APHY|nr:hypothetical protein NLI96_g5318 [Physisporinus lineatus]